MAVIASILNELSRALSAEDDEFDLAAAALLVARQEYPELDVEQYLERLDEMANTIRSRMKTGEGTVLDNLRALNRYLYTELGFSGNASQYFDPRNSFLNDVMDRRTGIPITLSLVHLEIGRRLGLDLQGVSFPGHFLVKLDLEDGSVILDPYHQGASLSNDELKRRAELVFGAQAPVDDLMPRLLESASKRDIIVRMLRNLKGIYREREDYERLVHVANMIVAIHPDNPRDIRDRGLFYEELGYGHGAMADYRRYLHLAPEAEDAQSIRDRLIQLQSRSGALH